MSYSLSPSDLKVAASTHLGAHRLWSEGEAVPLEVLGVEGVWPARGQSAADTVLVGINS